MHTAAPAKAIRITNKHNAMKRGCLKNRIYFCVLTGVIMTLVQEPVAAQNAGSVLARLETTNNAASPGVPIYAYLQDGAGQSYALTIASEARIKAAGLSFTVLDAPAGLPGDYIVLREARDGANQAAAGRYRLIYDDGAQRMVCVSPQQAGELSGMGFMLQRLPADPIVLSESPAVLLSKSDTSRTETIAMAYDPIVAEIVSRVQQTNLYLTLARLSGEQPVIVWGNLTNIYSRHTTAMSAIPIGNAAQFAIEQFQALGLPTRYCDWNYGGVDGRNVEPIVRLAIQGRAADGWYPLSKVTVRP